MNKKKANISSPVVQFSMRYIYNNMITDHPWSTVMNFSDITHLLGLIIE